VHQRKIKLSSLCVPNDCQYIWLEELMAEDTELPRTPQSHGECCQL
jgi:hypothetical protein